MMKNVNNKNNYFNNKNNYYICSYGGCGSKVLTKYLSNFGNTFHVHTRKPPTNLTFIKNEQFTNILVNKNDIVNYKVIYIYRNPIKAIYSRFQVPQHLNHIQSNPKVTLENVITEKKDLYGIEDFFNNYTEKIEKKRNYKICCVKYEDLFNNITLLNKTLMIPNIKQLYPIKKETINHIDNNNNNNNNELNNIYKNLIDKMNTRQFITFS
jgi:hypothetical protein